MIAYLVGALRNQHLKDVMLIPFFWLTQAVRKDKSIWLFGSWSGIGFRDNPRWMFEYCVRCADDISSYWVVSHKRELIHIPSELHKRVLIRGSIKYYYFAMRAGVVFYSHSPKSDIGYICNSSNTLKNQLWHGCPIKKIGDDDSKWTNRKRKNCGVIKKMANLMMPFRKELHDRAFAMSSYDEEIFDRIFKPTKGTVVTGYPRHNVSVFKSDLQVNYDGSVLKILYAPTFRKEGDSKLQDFALDEITIKKINNILHNAGAHLSLKLHPVVHVQDNFDVLSNFHFLPSYIDISEIMSDFDLLITDYSSLCFDFLVFGKPTLFLWHDYHSYQEENRLFYESVTNNLWGPIFFNWEDLMCFLGDYSKIQVMLVEKVKIAQALYAQRGAENVCQGIYQIVHEDIFGH